MTTAQLINQLQNWQAIHGVCKVYYQHTAMVSEELPVIGCAVAESENGTCDIMLFTTYEGHNGEVK